MLCFVDHPPLLELPLFSSPVEAGFPSPADDHIEGKLDLNEHLVRRPAATFFVRAAGESMRGAGIFDGDLVVIDRGITPQPDDIVIAVLHGELTVKRLQRQGDTWQLAAENPNFPTLPISDDGCEIWGIVTHSIRRHCGRCWPPLRSSTAITSTRPVNGYSSPISGTVRSWSFPTTTAA